MALAVNLRLAETVAARSPERAARVLAEQADAARDAIETLCRCPAGSIRGCCCPTRAWCRRHHTREPTESRRRLITAGDAERSRLERAIARQVVPHLAPLPDRLRQLSRVDRHAPAALDAALVGPLVASLNAALEALREITRGVFPVQLARSGLPTALGSLLARTGSTGRLVVEDTATARRYDPRVDAAAYFCVAEATRDLGAPVMAVLTARGDQLQLVVSGSDRGGLRLAHMRDRVEAAGGSVSMTGDDGHTVVEVRLPAPAPAPVAAS